jgi:LysR family transcriptional regulator for bpeEF and oprC
MDRLRAMEVFVAAMEAGSLSGGAARLGLSNAAVTGQLQALEAHLRVTLLLRSTRYLRPTAEGEAFYARCKAILADVEQAEAALRPLEDSAVLRVQVPIAVGHLVLAPALAAFVAEHPGLRVVTILGNDVDNLIRRGIDAAIRMDEVETDTLVARPIYRARHVICAAPDLLARQGFPATPEQIDPARCLGWVADSGAPPRPWRLHRGGMHREIRPSGDLAFNSSDALLSAAAQGAGFVQVLDLLAHAHLRAGRLAPVLPDWETDEQIFYLVYPKTHFVAPRLRAFADFAARAFPAHLRHNPEPPVRVRRRRSARD